MWLESIIKEAETVKSYGDLCVPMEKIMNTNFVYNDTETSSWFGLQEQAVGRPFLY